VTIEAPGPVTGSRQLQVIANAHMDPIWIWDWREGYGEVWATFRSALDRIGEHPDLIFTASSASHHAWIAEHDPAIATARGIPHTTLVSSSWAITLPPAAAISPAPRAPSEPIPVRISARLPAPQIDAADDSKASIEGRQKLIGASSPSARSP